MADEARLSQQVIEVLYSLSTEPTARVTIEYVEAIFAEVVPTNKQLSVNIVTQAIVSGQLKGITQRLSVNFTGTGVLSGKLRPGIEAGDLLQLTESLSRENILNISLSDTLVLSDTALRGKIRDYSLSDILIFTESVSGGKIKSLSRSDILVLSDSVQWSRPASDILILSDSVIVIYGGILESVSDTLVLTDSVSVLIVKLLNILDQLTLSDQVLVNIWGDHILSDIINFKQVVVGTLLDEYVILQSPYEGPETVIVLPKPLVGNTENLMSDLLIKKSMNGVTRTYVKHTNNRRLTYTFSMNRNKGLELERFFKFHNGNSIKLTNWEGEIWRVFLITNPLDYNQPRRGDPCGPRVEIDLEFEGVKISG